jgi:CheY-like chemotaxis protein
MDPSVILIIEDNPISLKFLKLTLESENYSVVEAADAASALRHASKQKFDLIIQDLILPDMDGFILNQRLRGLPGVEKIPIFALSGLLSSLDTQAKQTGFTLFLLKPIDPTYLLDMVKTHLPIQLSRKEEIGKGKHILIVDDNPIQLKLFAMQLRNLGFGIATAPDGIIALQHINHKKPDAVISDILMPNLDGFSLCAEIKGNPKFSSIPVMLLTSNYLEEEDFVLAKKMGASCYLTRTPGIERLVSELLEMLNTSSSETISTSFELTDEIKAKHVTRSLRQLDQQLVENAKLSQRCALLMSQLLLIGGIANALTTRNKDIEESLKEVLYFCLDAIGISKGALYIKFF